LETHRDVAYYKVFGELQRLCSSVNRTTRLTLLLRILKVQGSDLGWGFSCLSSVPPGEFGILS